MARPATLLDLTTVHYPHFGSTLDSRLCFAAAIRGQLSARFFLATVHTQSIQSSILVHSVYLGLFPSRSISSILAFRPSSSIFLRSEHPIPLPVPMSDELDAIRAQIQNYLVDLGNYDVISQLLKLKLFESGWLDRVTVLAAKELASHPASEPMNFETLYSTLKEKAPLMIPSSVKEEVVEQIRDYLNETI